MIWTLLLGCAPSTEQQCHGLTGAWSGTFEGDLQGDLALPLIAVGTAGAAAVGTQAVPFEPVDGPLGDIWVTVLCDTARLEGLVDAEWEQDDHVHWYTGELNGQLERLDAAGAGSWLIHWESEPLDGSAPRGLVETLRGSWSLTLGQ
jgi:hypothetical protein